MVKALHLDGCILNLGLIAMHEEYWQQRWQCNEIGFNQLQPNVLMQRYFPELNLKTGDRVFVPLCGKSIDMIWLACQGYKVVGVELNEQACKAFFKENKIRFKLTAIPLCVLSRKNQKKTF